MIDSFYKNKDKYNWEMMEGKSKPTSEVLGIDMTSVDDGKVLKMIQGVMINSILRTFGMEYCKYRTTSTDVVALLGTKTLGKDTSTQYELKYK